MPTTNSLMHRSRLPREAFIALLGLFAADAESYRIAEEIGVSRVTVSRIVTALRRRMAGYAPRLEAPGRRLELPEDLLRRAQPASVRGRRPTSESAVAAIYCEDRILACELLLGFPRAVWRYLDLDLGALEETRAQRLLGGADALFDLHHFELISLAPPREGQAPRFRASEMRLVEQFAAYARRHLQQVRGIPEDKLWLHLAELEFRFNRREQDLAAILEEMLRVEPLRLN